MKVTINILELASELADAKLNEMQQNALKYHPEKLPFPNGIVQEMENKDVAYTEDAQKIFNNLFEDYQNIIRKCIT